MRLRRLGSSHEVAARDYKGRDEAEGPTVGVLLMGFGPQSNDFQITLDWEDVEAIVLAFSEIGHPGALRIQRARKLAEDIEGLVKDGPNPK